MCDELGNVCFALGVVGGVALSGFVGSGVSFLERFCLGDGEGF